MFNFYDLTPLFNRSKKILASMGTDGDSSDDSSDSSDDSDEEEGHNCVCDYCGKSQFRDYRYHCLKCHDFDLCSRCFEGRKFDEKVSSSSASSSSSLFSKHERGHPWIRFDQPRMLYGERLDSVLEKQLTLDNFLKFYQNCTHFDFKCSFCGVEDFRGVRFSCEECGNYIQCSSCFKEQKTSKFHKVNHIVIAFGKLESLTIEEKSIEYIQAIGKGGFGTVFKARFKTTGRLVACKIMVSTESNISKESSDKSFYDEVNAYQKIKGKNILRMLGYFDSSFSHSKGIITEYMHKGNLREMLRSSRDRNLSDRRRFDILVQVAGGMARIHDLGFIHRDIRPDNILVDKKYRAKIGDMGIAKLLSEEKKDHTQIGAVRFMPPEFHNGFIDQQVDVFTFGLTIIELFSGSFTNVKGNVTINEKPTQLTDLVTECLDDNQDMRPKSRAIFSLLTSLQSRSNQYIKKQCKGYEFQSLYEKNKLFSRALRESDRYDKYGSSSRKPYSSSDYRRIETDSSKKPKEDLDKIINKISRDTKKSQECKTS